LVKLDTNHPPVEAWLLGAVEKWFAEFGADGLRLDAADNLDPAFLRALRRLRDARFPDCWLMGEVVHGDYTRIANPEMLDAVTNYEVYKGLWSAPNDRNCHEIAWALERQFGPAGIYRGLPLCNFLDNHDVDRIAETLQEKRHLYPVHALLFTMPGVPALYYGSEVAWGGKKTAHSDAPLRPALDPLRITTEGPERELPEAIRRLAALRAAHPALRRGSYRQVHVAAEQLVFLREYDGERLLVVLDYGKTPQRLELPVADLGGGVWQDLENGVRPTVTNGHLSVETCPGWCRVLAAG
jgi:glycosidase